MGRLGVRPFAFGIRRFVLVLVVVLESGRARRWRVGVMRYVGTAARYRGIEGLEVAEIRSLTRESLPLIETALAGFVWGPTHSATGSEFLTPPSGGDRVYGFR